MATGSGKTEVIIGLAKMMVTSLTIVPSKSSLLQTIKRFKNRGLESVGGFGGGLKDLTKAHTIATAAMFNSRLKKGDNVISKFLEDTKLLMFDEVHHLGTAPSWQAVGDACGATRRFGFSGSPWASGMPSVDLANEKESKLADLRVAAQVGETLVYIPSKMLRDMGVIIDPRIFVLSVSEPKGLNRNRFPRWNWVYKRGIVENETRNKLVVDAAYELRGRGHKTTILVVSIAHGCSLLKQLHSRGLTAAFTKGNDEVLVYTGKKIESHKDAGERTRDGFLAGDIDVLIGSVVIDEAIDLPGMSALILAGGMKSPIRAVQRVGRAIRTSDGKDEAIIIDFMDNQHYFLKNHTYKRLGIYDAHEYDYTECSWEELWEQL
jgi:superfamily II DNA or RNA helicase